MASAHDVVVLSLPPENALIALEYLADHVPGLPVLVIRPSVDEFAFNAGRLGAKGIVSLETIKTELASAFSEASFKPLSDCPFVPFRSAASAIADRRADLERGLRARFLSGSCATHVTALDALACMLVTIRLSFVEFNILGEAFRNQHVRPVATPIAVWLSELEGLVSNVPGDALSGGTRLQHLFDLFQRTGSRCLRLSCDSAADGVGLSPREFRRWIVRHTGYSYLACRRLFVTRQAMLALNDSDEHVAQIAFDAGYPQHHQLDRDVRRFLNVCPSEFRQLLKSARQRRLESTG